MLIAQLSSFMGFFCAVCLKCDTNDIKWQIQTHESVKLLSKHLTIQHSFTYYWNSAAVHAALEEDKTTELWALCLVNTGTDTVTVKLLSSSCLQIKANLFIETTVRLSK